MAIRIRALTTHVHRAGCALNSRRNCVFILSDNVELIIVALKLTKLTRTKTVEAVEYRFRGMFHDSQYL